MVQSVALFVGVSGPGSVRATADAGDLAQLKIPRKNRFCRIRAYRYF